MDAERLRNLVDAYGADPRRWPDDARAASDDLAGLTAPWLDEARTLDHALSMSPAARVSADLRDRVIASAAAAGLTPRRVRLWRDRLVLAFGASWAVAACAGVVAGVLLSAQIGADDRADAVFFQAAQPTLDDAEVLG